LFEWAEREERGADVKREPNAVKSFLCEIKAFTWCFAGSVEKAGGKGEFPPNEAKPLDQSYTTFTLVLVYLNEGHPKYCDDLS
jgi:hypothetical protein